MEVREAWQSLEAEHVKPMKRYAAERSDPKNKQHQQKDAYYRSKRYDSKVENGPGGAKYTAKDH